MITRGVAGIRLGPTSTASYGPISGGQGTAAEWVQGNPVLPIMWIGFESDTRKLKIGDGVSDWNTLPYWHDVLPYASVYGNEIGWTQASAVQDTWYPISDSDMADGLFMESSHDGSGKITVQTPGVYKIDFSASLEVSANNTHVQLGIMVNGSAKDDGIVHQETNVANQQFSLASFAIVRLVAGDYVQVGVRTTDAGTPNLAADHVNISMLFLGV